MEINLAGWSWEKDQINNKSTSKSTLEQLLIQDKVSMITEGYVDVERNITYYPIEYLSDIESNLDLPNEWILKWFPLASSNDVNYDSRVNIDNIRLPQELFAAYNKYFQNTISEFFGYSQEACSGYVVWLSWGIDSAVVLRLIQNSWIPVTPIIMGQWDHNVPLCEYSGTRAEWLDIQYAKNVCKDLGLHFQYIDLSQIMLSFLEVFKSESWVASGISPRVRSSVLYTFADSNNLIAAWTINGTEYILAAYSVWWPAGHISPIIDLYKSEVYALASAIWVPDYISKRKPLISELDVQDNSLYGVDCTILDPILRRLWFQKMTPEEISQELGHSCEWINRIKKLRIDGEQCRRTPPSFIVNRHLDIKVTPTITIDRSHFTLIKV